MVVETKVEPITSKTQDEVVDSLNRTIIDEAQALEGCDDELESEVHRLIHSKPGASDERQTSTSNQLRERTNTIQNDDYLSDQNEQDKSSKYGVSSRGDKENVGSNPVIRRSSILQLIEDTAIDEDDFDSDSEDEEPDFNNTKGGSPVPEVGRSLLQNGIRNRYSQEQEHEYQTPAIDSLYKMKEEGVLRLDDIPGDLDDTEDEFAAQNVEGPGLDSLEEAMVYTLEAMDDTQGGGGTIDTMVDTFDTNAQDGRTGTIGTMGASSEAQSLGTIDDDTFEGVKSEVNMAETMDTAPYMESEEEGGSMQLQSHSHGQDTYYEDIPNGGRLDSKANHQSTMHIDTYELTEEDKVWRSLTNHYASINSNDDTDTIDTHHTLISQDTNTLDTHHTLISQDSRGSGPQTDVLELEDTFSSNNTAKKVSGGWDHGNLATTGTLMLGDSHLHSLPENGTLEQKYHKRMSFNDRTNDREVLVMDAGDLILEDEDFF